MTQKKKNEECRKPNLNAWRTPSYCTSVEKQSKCKVRVRLCLFPVVIEYVRSGDTQQSQGLISSLITKIINNLQVTIKNIHIRYEDKLSVPGVSCLSHSVMS